MVWKKVVNSDPGDADHFGGNDVDKISDLLSGVDVDDVDIDSDFTLRSGRLKRRNPANTFTLTEINPAIAANKDRRAYQPYNYLVYSEGGTTYGVNGLTQAVDSSSATPTTVLQFAMDNLSAGRTQKEIVKVVGSFSVTSLTIPSYTVLDLKQAKLTQTAATNLNMLINNDTTLGNTDIEIFGGTIDGNKANQTADGASYSTRNTINLTKCTNSSVHDVTIQNSNSSSIYLEDCVTTHIMNNRMLSARKLDVHHAGTTAGKMTFINNNYMFNPGENFVGASLCSDLYIEGNLMDTCGTNGINVCGVRNHILNNIIKTCERGAITMGGEASLGPGDYSEITGNTCYDVKGGGIYSGVAQGGNYVTISFNKVKGHASLQDDASGRSFGIRMSGSYGIIEGNQVWDMFRSGIAINGQNTTAVYDSRALSSDRIQVKNNVCVNNGTLGATEATAYFKAGICLFGTSTETAYNTNVRMIGNTCYNNNQYGIMFRNSTGTVIEDNDCQGNAVGAIQNVASNV